MTCSIIERTSGLEPSSETTVPRYLKLVTVFSFCPFFIGAVCNQLVFSALISILYLVQILSTACLERAVHLVYCACFRERLSVCVCVCVRAHVCVCVCVCVCGFNGGLWD